MSLFGDIGNIFHSIGHFFSNGDNNNQPHPQAPVVVHPTVTGQAVAPSAKNNNQSTNKNNSQNNNQQPAPQPDPLLQLYQGPQNNVTPTAGTYDPNAPVVKAANAPQPAAQPSKPHASIIHDLTHNDLTDAAGTAAKTVGGGAAGAALGTLRAGEGLVQGVTDIPKLSVDLGTWAGDKISGTNYRPQFVSDIDQWTKDIDKPQQWLQKKTDDVALAYGPNSEAIYHPAQVAANVATLLPAASAIVSKVGEVSNLSKVTDAANVVNKFVDAQRAASPSMQLLDKVKAGVADQLHGDWGLGTDSSTEVNKIGTATDTKVAAGVQRPDEVTTGVSSVNSSQGADALSAIQQKEAEAAANAPVQSSGQSLQPADTSLQSSSTPPQIQPSQTPNSGPEAAPQQTVAISPQEQPPVSPQIQPPLKENPSSEPPIVNTPNNVAQKPNAVNPNSAPSAPNVVAQLKKDLQTAGNKAPKLEDPSHDVLSNDELNQAANRFVQSQSDEDLLKSYSTGANIKDAQSLAAAVASTKRLGEMSKAGVEGADQAIENILDGAAQGTSGAGRLMNYVQNIYDQLPQPAKVKYLIRSIDKARENSGLAPLSDAESAHAETTIDHFLTETENANNATAAAEGEIQAIKDKIGTGQLTQDDLNKIAEYDKVAKDNSLVAQKTQGDLARAYNDFAPQKLTVTSAGDRAGNLARSLMLTSVSGRISDVATTSVNVLHTLAQNSVEAAIGRILNAGRDAAGQTPGKYIDTLPSANAFVHGTGEGLEKAAGNYRGNTYVSDVQSAIKTGSEGGKTQLQRAQNKGPLNKVRNFSHAMAETATNLSNGVKNTKILQMAYQEGKARGLDGLDLDVYAHSTAALPSRQMAAKGEQLVEEVNNMNDNPFTHGLESVAKGLDKIPVVGEQVRNLIAPFNRWVGGQMWNGITDKNAVANVLKMGKAMLDGDSQEAVHQLAGFATNTLGTMSAGYALAKSGVLTNTNAEGYNDDGLYLHLGGHFIPVSFFGFAAPGIVMGWATHEAFKDNAGKPVWQKILHSAGEVLTKTAGTLGHAYLGNTVIGGGSELINQVQDAVHGRANVTGGDVGATAATDAAGSYIPGAMGDVNTAINTFDLGGLNPTHEAALTKVTKGQEGVITKDGNLSKSKDIPATDLNQFINKIPVVGQKVLPRNPGVAANDFGSRIVRGDNQSATEVKDQYDAAHPTGPAAMKANEQADRAKFIQSNKETGTINGKTYVNYNGKVTAYDTPLKAQQALDYEHFKESKQTSGEANGMVYQRGSNGKITVMERKDYDYKNAEDQITSAKNSGDVSGYAGGIQGLLENVGWQLNHADLTQAQRDTLTQKAVQMQEEFAKTQQYGGFTKPKGADSYATPQITGAKDGYVKAIQQAGAKYGVDINALLSVAAQEGLGGGVGDNGTSFGPFQMHEGGALPPGKDQKWAESPEGIDYAIQQIAKAAKGKTGAEAIKAIVTQFERSADQPGEIARALELYNGGKATLSPGGGVSSQTGSDASSTSASDLVKSNTIGSLPVMARESFIENGLTAKPVTPNIPQIKLTPPETLIKAHKITVGMPKA